MTSIATRRFILRANALYLGGAAVIAFFTMDLRGILFASGPVAKVLGAAPEAAIGFVEAHGLALILAVLLWRAAPVRSWHLTAAAVHLLLGTANLVFWDLFVVGDALAGGYVTTSLHWLFVGLQLFAAATAPRADRQ